MIRHEVTPSNVIEVGGRIQQGVVEIAHDPFLMKAWTQCRGVRSLIGQALRRGPYVLQALLEPREATPQEIVNIKHQLIRNGLGHCPEVPVGDWYINHIITEPGGAAIIALDRLGVQVTVQERCNQFVPETNPEEGPLELTPEKIRYQVAETVNMTIEEQQAWCASRGLKVITLEKLLQLIMDQVIAAIFKGFHPWHFVNYYLPDIYGEDINIRCANVNQRAEEEGNLVTALTVRIHSVMESESDGTSFEASMTIKPWRADFKHEHWCTLGTPF